jgi:uncharacterized protein DUF6893
MSIVGEVTLGVIAVVVLIGLVVGLRSIPDVRRYLKIRNM